MILFYSGAQAPNNPSNQIQSTGGFISNTPVPNGMINNLFSEITRSTLRQNVNEYKLIVLQNTTGATVNNLKIWTEVQSTWFSLEIAVVEPVLDTSCNKYYFEQIPNISSPPYQAILTSHEGQGNAVDVGPFQNQKYLGIWIRRKLLQNRLDMFTQNQNNQQCNDDSIQQLETVIANQQSQETFNLILDWS